MKNLFLIPINIILLLSCSQPGTEHQPNGTMSGIYELRTLTYKGGNMDTTFPAQNQVKIYTEKYYMYGATRPDSSAFFGFGSYIINDSSVLERSIFNSYALDSVSQTNLKISRSDTGYNQMQPGVMMQGNTYEVEETYRTLPETEATELDGVWELVSFSNITGTDTTVIPNKQFKIYKGGHFMWIHRYPTDPSGLKFNKGYGYGKFMVNKNTVTETIIVSNYPELIETPITVNFKLKGNNELSLIFDDGNSTTTETYRRLN
jgi:hypothetical protein